MLYLPNYFENLTYTSFIFFLLAVVLDHICSLQDQQFDSVFKLRTAKRNMVVSFLTVIHCNMYYKVGYLRNYLKTCLHIRTSGRFFFLRTSECQCLLVRLCHFPIALRIYLWSATYVRYIGA